MYLSHLRLAGFKSFVEPTDLQVAQGLTGIVGPNGCGKSNLVEALRWVMGETSAKSMRGGAMDDVIFAGTANRPARNLAEVALNLENTSRDAPAAFNDSDEILVTRKIERESGSVYRINGRDVRARDVQLLFADVATGAHSPAMVSQGRIGNLISAKPRDRRTILEEAAGITGLHSRRHEAELRLRAAENNLIRLEDVTGQIEVQLKALKRQSRQAKRYRRIGEHLRQLEATLLYLRWRESDEAVREAEAELAKSQSKVQDLTQNAAKASTAQIAAAENLPPLRDNEAAAAAALHRLAVERDGLDEEERRAAEARERLEGRIRQLGQDVERENAQATDAVAAVTRLDEEKAGIEAAAKDQENAEQKAQDTAREAATLLMQSEAALDTANEEAASAAVRRTSLGRQMAELRDRLQRLAAQLAEIETEQESLPTTDDAGPAIDRAAAAVGEARAELDSASTTMNETENSRLAAQEAENQARETLHVAREALTHMDAETAALERLLAGDGNGDWSPIIDDLSVEPGLEAALGAALGDDLTAAADAGAPLHWAEVPGSENTAELPDGAEALSNFVRAPDVLARRLAQIGLVSEQDGPVLRRQLAQGQRLVSREGSLWRWDGYTVSANAEAPAAARLAQRNRLKELAEARPATAEQEGKARADFEGKQAAAAASVEAEAAARQDWRAADATLSEALTAHADIVRQAGDRDTRRAALMEAEARIGEDRTETEARLKDMEKSVAELPAEAGLQDSVTACRAEVEAKRRELAEAQAAHGALARESAQRAERLAAIDGERAAWSSRAESAQRQLQELATRGSEAEKELAEIQDVPRLIAERRDILLTHLEEAEKKRSAAADALSVGEDELASAEANLKEIQDQLGSAREDRVRAEATCEQGGERRENIVVRVRELLDCTPEQVPEVAEFAEDEELPPPEQLEAKIERLKRERDNIGPVNLRAEVEAEELTEQMQALESEREDLEGAIARLRQGISSLNRQGRQRLLGAFNEVNTHFGTLFERLFGGGRAYLELTESEDPLDAGLEIMAQPPGKKLQIMSLLSGGEQALTALSLIFAVFLTNPAPICVLDEVDAPLDDANVERFCNLIKEITKTTGTRFLVVTHNAITMSNMHRLFGITMVEKGVSQIVSVDLEEAEEMAAVG